MAFRSVRSLKRQLRPWRLGHTMSSCTRQWRVLQFHSMFSRPFSKKTSEESKDAILSAPPSQPAKRVQEAKTLMSALDVSPKSSKDEKKPPTMPPPALEIPETPEEVTPEAEEEDVFQNLTPAQMVEILNEHIIGQNSAKRSVALAIRNRWRRNKITNPELADEIVPHNILMVGPTGCGKTEIARRIAKLGDFPFVKVEATKFTEVGFHGTDVVEIIRDLFEDGVNVVRRRRRQKNHDAIRKKVEDTVLLSLIGPHQEPSTMEAFRRQLQQGLLDSQKIEVAVPVQRAPFGGNFANHDIYIANDRRTEMKTMQVKDAIPILEEMEAEQDVESGLIQDAVKVVENEGIVFIDEIDKICFPANAYRSSSDASATGVQRDLLPLIEGCQVSVRKGQASVKTNHILFICAGAFHECKPQDLLAELQGRLPVQVEFKALTRDDLYRILTEPKWNLVRKQQELMQMEDVEVKFSEETLREIANVAFEANSVSDNIGARRLHTIIEKVMEDVSFQAAEPDFNEAIITPEIVRQHTKEMLEKTDLKRYII